MMQYKTHQIELTAQHLCTQLALDGYALARGMKIQAMEQMAFACHDVIVRFHKDLYGKKLDDFSVKYPADWLQAFKARWFPDWLKKRYPVQYKTETVNLTVVFPEWVEPASRQLGRAQVMITRPVIGSVGLFDGPDFRTSI